MNIEKVASRFLAIANEPAELRYDGEPIERYDGIEDVLEGLVWQRKALDVEDLSSRRLYEIEIAGKVIRFSERDLWDDDSSAVVRQLWSLEIEAASEAAKVIED